MTENRKNCRCIRRYGYMLTCFLLQTIDFYRICGIYNDIEYYCTWQHENKCNLAEKRFIRDSANDMQVSAAGKLKRKYSGKSIGAFPIKLLRTCTDRCVGAPEHWRIPHAAHVPEMQTHAIAGSYITEKSKGTEHGAMQHGNSGECI